MNEKCKYCDYVSKCSRICEYNSYLCKVYRSFPKVVDKSYEQLKQENEHLDEVNCKLRRTNVQLKDTWKNLKQIIKKKFVAQGGFTSYEWNDLLNDLLNKMQELEGSDSNE